MNSKTIKKLRQAAGSGLKNSKLKGVYEREQNITQAGTKLGATKKQIKRAVRVVSNKFGQMPPKWAQRLLHNVFKGGFIPA